MNKIDKIDRYAIQGPFFQILVKHLDEKTLKDVFIDIRKKEFLDDLPKHFLDDIQFLKRCAENSIINIFDFPEKYQTTEFISKELYIEQLKFFKFDLSCKQIYPQDDEIALRFLQLSSNFYSFVEPKFKDIILSDNQKVDEIISKNISFITYLPQEQASRKEVIYSVLEHPIYSQGDKATLLKPNLKFNKDPEVVLKVLEKLPNIHKHLNQKFVSIFKQNSIKTNHHNFLKLYLLNQKLDENLEKKEDSNKKFKV